MQRWQLGCDSDQQLWGRVCVWGGDIRAVVSVAMTSRGTNYYEALHCMLAMKQKCFCQSAKLLIEV